MRGFTCVFVILFLISLVSISFVKGKEYCPRENCMEMEKCESSLSSIECAKGGEICCSIVKMEFRTHCRHFGGECMDSCPEILKSDTVDCAGDSVCCVLVK